MTSTVDTLVEDIYNVISKGIEPSEENLKIFADNLVEVLKTRLAAPLEERKNYLRMSSIGRPDRQVYYDVNEPEGGEEIPPFTLIKFLYGDVIEELVLFLAREAGHKVTEQQKEVSLDGVKGHIDCYIDGVLIDVKSTSKYAFRKFEKNTLRHDDPFGYMGQISGYSQAEGGVDAGFLALNKEEGKLALLKFSGDELELEFPQRSVKKKREALAKDTPPERCYPAVPEGKSGNMKLDIGCDYCKHKFKCWADANDGEGIRVFQYSSKPLSLVKVVKEPKVPEITKKGK